MYRYKKALRQSVHQLNLCEWFRRRYGNSGEQAIRYKISRNKGYPILLKSEVVDVIWLGYDYYYIDVYVPISSKELNYIYGSSFGYEFWLAKMEKAYILTDLSSIGSVFEWDAYKLAKLLEENETQKVILTQSYEMLEITLLEKSKISISENRYMVVVKQFRNLEELRGQGKIFISEERACIFINKIYGTREVKEFKKNKRFQGKILVEDEDTEATFWGYSLKSKEKESAEAVSIKLEESTIMRYSPRENGARSYWSSYKVNDRRYYELEVY